METPRLKEQELKRKRESMSPISSGVKTIGFKFFKRRKSLNAEEESSKAIISKEPTIVILSGDPIIFL